MPVSSGTFIYVFLPRLGFEAGIATDVRRTIEDAAAILLLAVVAAPSLPKMSSELAPVYRSGNLWSECPGFARSAVRCSRRCVDHAFRVTQRSCFRDSSCSS